MTDITPLVKANDRKPAETTAVEADDTRSFHEANNYLTSQKKRNYCLVGIIILIIIGVAVGLTVYFVSDDSSSSPLEDDEESLAPTMEPTMVPTREPSIEPTMEPTNNPTMVQNWPITASTWPWLQPTETAWVSLMDNDDSLDAVQRGCEWCEQNPAGCDFSVGYGGSPDTNGDTKLDALIMYGPTHDSGSVASMRNIRNAIGVARYVMHYTVHSMLVGDAATEFALQMGFENSSLNGSRSWSIYQNYLANNCTPNGWKNVVNVNQCPPYQPIPLNETRDMFDTEGYDGSDIDVKGHMDWSKMDHDTIGVIAIDSKGYMSIGTSTNGATYKVPGRVGDSPIPGSGGYVEQGTGGCVGTGDGDIMMRFAPCKAAVTYMKMGMSVGDGCRAAMDEIVEYYPGVFASLVCMDYNGNVDASTSGLDFPYTYRDRNVNESTVVTVPNPYR